MSFAEARLDLTTEWWKTPGISRVFGVERQLLEMGPVFESAKSAPSAKAGEDARLTDALTSRKFPGGVLS
jgi:hypothetical protein